MSTFTDRIKVIIDVVGDGASAGLSKFRTDLASSDGAVGKFKTSASAGFDFVKQNAAGFALSAGTALVGFGVKSVMAFQETALEAGKLRDSLGLSAEEASRLMEVAGDLDIPVKNLENSIGKMNVVAERSPKFFDDIGAAIVRNQDGTTNVNETFLNVVDSLNRIPNATERASAAQRIFGKDWRTISELIGRGADELRRNLADVGDAKIIDDEEIAKARAMRDRMDEFKDSLEEVSLTAGEFLVPALTSVTGALLDVKSMAESIRLPGIVQSWYEHLSPAAWQGRVVDGWNAVGGAIRGLWEEEKQQADFASTFTQAQSMVNESIAAASREFELAETRARDYTDAQDLVEDAITEAVEAQEKQNETNKAAREEFRKLADGVYDLYDAEDDLAASIENANTVLADEESSLRDVASVLRDVARDADAVAQKQVELAGQTLNTDAGMRTWTASMLATAATLGGPMATEILNHVARVNGIPEEKITDVQALIERGKLDEAERLLNDLARGREVPFIPKLNDARGVKYYANGTNNTPEGWHVVGDRGPELARFKAGGAVMPNSELRRVAGGSSGSSMTVINNWPAGVNPDSVLEAQRRYERRNGSGT